MLKNDRAAAENDADSVVEDARTVADAVVGAARREADRTSAQPQPAAAASAVAGARAKADRLVHAEREAADDALNAERENHADVFAALLVHERAATDAYLLTERARADDAVAHRDDFLGMVAHDVRNLLTLVLASLALPGDPATRIRRYVGRMNRLIGDLVDVTSIDAGKLAVAPHEGNAVALVNEALEAFAPAAGERGVAISAALPAGPLSTRFDHDRALQVLANLLSNAIKFTPAGGSITVSVEVDDGKLHFRVSDTGVGIPAAMLDAIFERFWQVGKTDRRGLGLGLYISKCIVEAHGGRIWAESQLGSGSQLNFTLPISDSPTAGRQAKRGKRRGRR